MFLKLMAAAEISTLSLHDALPISLSALVDQLVEGVLAVGARLAPHHRAGLHRDRKSTRLDSSHVAASYAVCCLKKKKVQTVTEIEIAQITGIALDSARQRSTRGCV